MQVALEDLVLLDQMDSLDRLDAPVPLDSLDLLVLPVLVHLDHRDLLGVQELLASEVSTSSLH